MRVILIAITLGVWAGVAQAQDTVRRVEALDRVVVVGLSGTGKVAAPRVVELPTVSMGEALKMLTPVHILDYGRGARQEASLRGTGASHTGVWWNGLPINSTIEGSVDLAMWPAASTDRLSVAPGAAALAEGSGGLGGGITLGSVARWNEPLAIEASLGYGSFNSWDASAAVRTSGLGRVQSSTKASFSSSTNDFWFINRDIIDPSHPGEPTWQRNANAQYQLWSVAQDIFVRDDHQGVWTISLLAADADRNLPQLTTYEGPANSNLTHSRNTNLLFSAAYRRVWNRWLVEASLAGGYEWTSFDKQQLTSSQDYMASVDAASRGARGQFRGKVSNRIDERHTVSGTLVLGGAWAESYETVRATGFDRGRFEGSAAADWTARWADRWTTTVLVRGDAAGDRAGVSALGEVAFEAARGLRLVARGSYNHHNPSLSSLYYTPGGNPDLRSERGPTAELGVSFQRSWITASVTAFGSWIEDWIIWLPTSAQYWTPQNLRAVQALGVEAMVDCRWVLPERFTLSVRGSLAVNRTTNEGVPLNPNDLSQGQQLPFVPLVSAGALARLEWAQKWRLSYWMSGQTQMSNSTAADPSFLSKIEPYALHNIGLGYTPWPWGEVSVECRNVLNSQYYGVMRRPMASRYFGVRLAVDF